VTHPGDAAGHHIANDKSIIGLIGPGFGETKATMPTFESAGLPMITQAHQRVVVDERLEDVPPHPGQRRQAGPGVVSLIKGIIKAPRSASSTMRPTTARLGRFGPQGPGQPRRQRRTIDPKPLTTRQP